MNEFIADIMDGNELILILIVRLTVLILTFFVLVCIGL